jgi:hypothetical protein
MLEHHLGQHVKRLVGRNVERNDGRNVLTVMSKNHSHCRFGIRFSELQSTKP